MRYQYISPRRRTRNIISSFGGYDHNPGTADGCGYEETNITGELYPVLSARKKRGTFLSCSDCEGIIGKDALCWVRGTKVYINSYEVTGLTVSAATDMNPKTMISMGAYLIILPDKVWVNTSDLTDYGNLEAHVAISTTVSYSMTDMDASAISPTVSSTAPSNPANMDYWMDTSQNPHVLKQWSASSSMWATVAASYIKIAANGIGAVLNEGDGVFFTGLPASMSDYAEGASVLQKVYHGEDGVGDYLLILGQLDSTTTTAGLTVDRKLPDMDFVIESNNRLWGCKYGIVNGKAVNEIYASKLGDFKNWYCYEGISTDSYAVSLGSDGIFTGAVNHLGYPCFFKENVLHKIYVSAAGAHQMQETTLYGIAEGSERSAVIVGQVLYYLSRAGIMAYDGSLPTKISDALGQITYQNGVAGAKEKMLYIAMQAGNEWNLFTYDTNAGTWHREDDEEVKAFASCRGELYYISSGKAIRSVGGSGTEDSDEVEWEWISGIMGSTSPDAKTIRRVDLNLALEEGSECEIFLQTDEHGVWESRKELYGEGPKVFDLPIIPKRAKFMRLKLRGSGGFRLYSIALTVEVGSTK